jgi:hypothetical protein
MTYEITLTSYRNAVNRKHPPNKEVKKTRRINEISSRGNQQGRGRGRGRGHGRGRGRGRNQGRGGGNKRQRNDAWFINDINGNQMEVHPSYKFNDDEWPKIPQPIQQQLIQMRNEYKRNRQSYSSQGSMQYPASSHISAVSYQGPYHPLPPIAQVPVPPPPPLPINGHGDQRSTVSEVTTDNRNNPTHSIMGGRNEQASLRSRNSNICQIRTSTRHIRTSNTRNIEPPVGQTGHCESDSNADTCCLGQNFIPIHITNRTADVYPYDDSYAPMTNVPIVSGATAYDHDDGNTYILVFHESLYYGTRLKHSLINPNQLHHHGVAFWDNPYDPNHDLCIDTIDAPPIPLKYSGTKLTFTTKVPNAHE